MKRILPLLLLSILLVSCQEFEKNNISSYESVVIVGIDGAGSFIEDSSITGFKEVFSEHSAVGYHCTCETPSVSAQNWGSYLHGVTPQKHKCVNGSIACERFPYSRLPSIFKIVRDVYPEAELASFCEWNAINYGLIEPSAKVNKSSDVRFCSVVHNTEQIKTMTLDYLSENTPKLLFVHIEDVDEAGHAHGYPSAEYMAAIQNDVNIVAKIDKLIDYNKTLFIVVTDHGGIDYDHGGNTTQETEITIAIKGKTINQMTLEECTPKDVSVIVLEALGIKKPSFMEGNIPEGITL